MDKPTIFTKTGGYWHYNPLGTGVIYTYHTKSMQVLTTCAHTGQMINVVDFYEEGGYSTPEEFKADCDNIYLTMIDEGITIDFDYMDNPDIIESGSVCLGFDLELLKN